MRYFILALMVFNINKLCAQLASGVSIGKNNMPPHPSSILELSANNKGFLLPRLTSSQRNNISNPAEGLLVYDITVNKFYYYSSGWKTITSDIQQSNTWNADSSSLYTDKLVEIGGNLNSTDAMLSIKALNKRGMVIGVDADSLFTATSQMFTSSNIFFSQKTNNVNGHNNLMLLTISDETSNDINNYTLGVFSLANSSFNDSLGYNSSITCASLNDSRSANNQTIGVFGMATYIGNYERNFYNEVDSSINTHLSIGGFFSSEPDNTNSKIMNLGVFSMASTDNKGFNIGTMSGAGSDSTYANIGYIGIVNPIWDSQEESLTNMFSETYQRYSEKFSASIYTKNYKSDSSDFNIYAWGTAKSYFGGNIGIQERNPSEALHVNGNILSNGVITQSSDIHLKKSIEPLSNALSKILSLNGISFFWKDKLKDADKQIGLLAQDVEKVFPELVQSNADGYKSVNYSGVIAPLIEAIKSLNNKINTLESELINEKNEIIYLKSIINNKGL